MINFELHFALHAPDYSIYKLNDVPDLSCLSASADFLSLSISPNEITLICASDCQVTGCTIDQTSLAWRCLEVVSEHPTDVVGLIAFVSNSLARAGISLLTVSSFAGDFFLIKQESLSHATAVLSAAGSLFVSKTEPTRSPE